MTRNLGDFGTAHDPNDATFGYFGVEIRVHPDLSDLAVVQLFGGLQELTGGASVIEKLEQVAATLVHPDDVDRFWRLVRANRQTMKDLAELAAGVVAAIAERPTQLPSDSSGGQPTTDTRSEDDSRSLALAELKGRPDLQVAVLREAG